MYTFVISVREKVSFMCKHILSFFHGVVGKYCLLMAIINVLKPTGQLGQFDCDQRSEI